MQRSGPSTRVFVRRVLFAALVVGACVSRRTAGEECVFSDDCVSPLVCAARRCRLSCRSDRDCANGQVCRPSGQIALRVCLAPAEPWRCAVHEDCTAPEVCGPGGMCQRSCREDYDCRFVGFGARCAAGLCALSDAGAGDDRAEVSSAGDARDATSADDATSATDVAVAPDASGADVSDGQTPLDAARDAGLDAATTDLPPATDLGPADAGSAMDVPGLDVGDRPRLPTTTFFDVAPYDAPRPLPLRSVALRGRVCATLTDGRVYCAGPNPSNALGVVTDAGVVFGMTPAPELTGAVEIVMGSDSTCARINDGTVRCVGRNNIGQLGNGRTTDSATFVTVTGVAGATSLVGGDSHYCALLGDATMRCWGWNLFGQIGRSPGANQPTPVSPNGVSGVRSIAAGEGHTCAVLMTGAVMCWGVNNYGQLGTNNPESTGPTPTAVVGLSSATQVSASHNNTCVLTSEGAAWCWGYNAFGQHGNGAMASEVRAPVRATALPPDLISIHVGGKATCVLHGAERFVSCVGFPPLGDGTASAGSSIVTPRRVLDLRGVSSLHVRSSNIAGATSFAAVRSDGTAVVWGEVGIGVFGPRALTIAYPWPLEVY